VPDPSTKRTAWISAGAAIAPFAVAAVYLAFSRWPNRWFTEFSDYAALAASVLVSVGFIWLLPIRTVYRIALTVVVIPILAFLLVGFALGFVCGVFGDCL